MSELKFNCSTLILNHLDCGEGQVMTLTLTRTELNNDLTATDQWDRTHPVKAVTVNLYRHQILKTMRWLESLGFRSNDL